MASTHQAKGRATAGEGANIIVARAIYTFFLVIILFILVRMVLLMMGIGFNESLANFIYVMSGVFVSPFFLVLGYTPAYGAPVFELSSLIAILFYILLGWGLAVLVTMGSWHSDEI